MFEQATRCCMKSLLLHLAWARWEEESGRLEEASEILERFEEVASCPWEVKVQRAFLEVRRGEELEARLLLGEATETGYNEDISVGTKMVLEYSEFLSLRGEAAEAEMLLEEALEKDPESAKLYKALMSLLIGAKKHSKLVKVYESAILNVQKGEKLNFYKDYINVGQMLGLNVSKIVQLERDFRAACDRFKGTTGVFECMECDAVLTTKANLLRHNILMHEPAAGIECDRCLRIFDTGKDFKDHKKDVMNPCLARCQHCSFKSKSRKLFNNHYCVGD